MTYRPLQPGDLGCDFSGFRLDAPHKIAEAKHAGCRFVIRYSAGVGDGQDATRWKLITPEEHGSLLLNGFDVIANSEWYESRVTEGASAGAADGAADLGLWKSCGHAQGATIYASWDQSPSRSKWWSVLRYARAYKKAVGGYYDVDCYAGTTFLRWLLGKKIGRGGWRPNAGSWSNDGLPYQPDTSTPAKRAALVALACKATPARIWQTGNYWFAKNADENLILRVPVGSHLEALHPTPSPTPKPSPTPNLDMGPTVEAIMALDRTSPEYQALLADIAQAVATYQVTIPKKGKWSIRTTLASIWQHAKAADK